MKSAVNKVFVVFYFHPSGVPYLKVGKVLLHEAVDLAHWETACFAVLQRHCNQTTTGQRKTGNIKRLHILSHRSGLATSDPSLKTQTAG